MFSNLILFAYVKPCAHLQCYKMMRVKRAAFLYARVYEFDVLDAFDIIANEIIMIFLCVETRLLLFN